MVNYRRGGDDYDEMSEGEEDDEDVSVGNMSS